MKVVTLKAEPREPSGSSGARRARREGRLPAVVYGEGETPSHISLETNAFRHAVEHGARVIDLDVGSDAATRVLLKDLQYDALGAKLVHADFLRLSANTKIELAVPLDLLGTPVGVQQGGILTVLSATVAVRCLPRDIPENLPFEVAGLEMGGSVKASDVPLPAGVELAADADQVLLSITVPRGLKGAAAEGDGESEEGGASEGSDVEDGE